MKPRLLVIRGGAIGDFILTLPALRLLRENFPQAHLEIVGYQHIIALADQRGYADATRSIEYGPLAAFFSRTAERSPELSAYFASFQQVVSFLYDPDGIFEANIRSAGVKNFLPAYVKPDDADHAARQLARPLESLALYLEEAAAQVYPKAEDHAAVGPLVEGLDSRPLIATHPGSGSPKKNWPLERWALLGRQLAASPAQPTLVLAGGEADHERLDALAQAWHGLPYIVARDLPLPHLAALLQRCGRFLGHDSGISHLAAAVGCRCLLLFGPTDPDVWAPANPGVEVLRAPQGNLQQLPVATVQACAERLF